MARIDERAIGPVTVLDVKGTMTLADPGGLKEIIVRLIAEGRLKVILSLGELRYIDSSGLGEIVRAYALAPARITRGFSRRARSRT